MRPIIKLSNVSVKAEALERKVIVMSHLETNFCKREHMSVCTAGSQTKQTDCRFYEKSQFADRCMYFIFDEYCDCLKAQLNAERKV